MTGLLLSPAFFETDAGDRPAGVCKIFGSKKADPDSTSILPASARSRVDEHFISGGSA